MNILYFDVSAFIILLIIFICNMTQKLTHGRSNRYFMGMILLSILATIGDFGSGFGGNYFEPSKEHELFMYITNYIYFFSHNNIHVMFFMYCISTLGVWHIIRKRKMFICSFWTTVIIANLLFVINPFFHNVFYIDENMQYCRGNLIFVTYAIAIVQFVYVMYSIVKYRRFVAKEKWIVLLIILPINSCAIIIQGLIANALVEMFLVSIAISMLVILLLRREELADPVSGAKKYNTCLESFRLIMDTETPVKVIFVKCVNNKNIRVYLGQTYYNHLLSKISTMLKKLAKEAGIVADVYYLEYGLFALKFEDANLESVRTAALYISDYYRDFIKLDELEVSIDARICIVNCPEDIDDYQSLFRFATTYHETMPASTEVLEYRDYEHDKEFIVRNEIDEIIRDAIDNDGFEMYYQPIYSTKLGRYVAAEALIRLKDPQYGHISPAIFIPAAEASGANHEIGAIVLDKVCQFIDTYNVDKYGIEYVQINMASSQYLERELADKVLEVLAKYKLSPDKIYLEITESAADSNPEVVNQNMFALSKAGVRFALDDYGAGYSNIRRTTSLPIEQVKLDKSFIDRIDDPQIAILIEQTIKMLKAMGKSVLIQGVEEEKIANHYIELGCDYMQGCDYIQGFYYCNPLPAEQFIEHIKLNQEKNNIR